MLKGLFLVVVGATMAGTFLYALGKSAPSVIRAIFSGATAQGTVLNVQLVRSTRTREIPVLTFAFTALDGRRAEFTKPCPIAPPTAKPGDVIAVRYDPANPQTVALVGDTAREVRSLAICLVIALLAIGGILLGVRALQAAGH